MTSRLLDSKKVLITGVMTRRSIAYSVAEAALGHGADVLLTSFGRARRITERTARSLPGCPDVLELDVSEASDFLELAEELRRRWGVLDGVLHAVAFAPPDALGGRFLSTPSTSAIEAFHVSAFSFKALGAALAPLLARSRPGGSMVGLDFDSAVAWPNYDWMGVAKAALEAVARYLARDLGDRGIRVNLVSAGPLNTPAASGVPGFERLAQEWAAQAPLGWRSDCPEVVADTICFLFSDLARGVSAEIVHVDGGAHAMGSSL